MTFGSAALRPEPDEGDGAQSGRLVAQPSGECSAEAQAPLSARRRAPESVWSPPEEADRSWPYQRIRGSSSGSDRTTRMTLRLRTVEESTFGLGLTPFSPVHLPYPVVAIGGDSVPEAMARGV